MYITDLIHILFNSFLYNVSAQFYVFFYSEQQSKVATFI
jgi:hypothetical protein